MHDIPIFDMQCTPTPRCQGVLFAKFLVPRVEVIYSEMYGTRYQDDQNLVCVLSVHKDRYAQFF